MTTLDDLLEGIEDEHTQARIQREFYAHQAGVSRAMERLLEIRHDALSRERAPDANPRADNRRYAMPLG